MSEERDIITVEILKLTYTEWVMTISEFIAWVQAAPDNVPEEFRGNISVISKERECNDVTYNEIVISYTRLESDDELNKRIENKLFWKKDRENQERKEYERLKAKYEHKGV